MGGEWGVGASLAHDRFRRTGAACSSGILQSGYSVEYLLAAVAARTSFPRSAGAGCSGWARAGAACALYPFQGARIGSLEAASRAGLSAASGVVGEKPKVVLLFARPAHAVLAVLTLLRWDSDFLKAAHGIAANTVANLAILYSVGAIVVPSSSDISEPARPPIQHCVCAVAGACHHPRVGIRQHRGYVCGSILFHHAGGCARRVGRRSCAYQ